MKRTTHTPLRMCMACGGRAPQGDLLRVARDAAGLRLVVARRAEGRTGYLHRRRACWEQFTARKGALRSLGCAVDKPQRTAFVHELKQSQGSETSR